MVYQNYIECYRYQSTDSKRFVTCDFRDLIGIITMAAIKSHAGDGEKKIWMKKKAFEV